MEESGKTAVVAGGSAGAGRAVVSCLIDAGYRVGIIARGEDRLQQLEATYGAQVLTRSCDVSDAEAVERAGAEIEAALGPVEVWVNAAMLTSFSPFARMPSCEFDRIVDATLLGVVNGTRTAIRLMEARNRGRIVNIGSGLSYRAVPYQSAYCTAKHGVNGFSSAIRSELIREGARVTVSLVQLPSMNTPQFDWARNRLSKKPRPAAPVFQPELAAAAVMRAVREGRREYLVGTSVLQLVFANMVFPDWLDHRLADRGAEMQKSQAEEPGNRDDNLDTPVPGIDATPHGSFGSLASGGGRVVDGDRARWLVFGALPVAGFALGLLLG
ncbi:SDR family oxidoreductase [Tropicimonas sediminicola]|uniref:Short-chain dehydrogenase n=1 Tax=Tropicimonas sediminicola TaxID=1031541 RepID=A0A239M020_9RHOB|nr:SDR family oxidoreductase [Tropicimonas sediminicola]SNT35393.1 Short-chain dehydrogenase [Tropicimonas sediminicola]